MLVSPFAPAASDEMTNGLAAVPPAIGPEVLALNGGRDGAPRYADFVTAPGPARGERAAHRFVQEEHDALAAGVGEVVRRGSEDRLGAGVVRDQGREQMRR